MMTSGCVHWLFGRGASIACNLTWSVPSEWADRPREEKVRLTKAAIRAEMDSSTIDTTIYSKFLSLLAQRTVARWRHRFITTNWDYLLQRVIESLELRELPSWLANSHVYHVNGTVEELDEESYRSPFLLEDDAAGQRTFTPEANMAYTHMIWDTLFVVIGISFECQTDRFLLQALNRVEDDLPIGESTWIVINPDRPALDKVTGLIQDSLPCASVKGVQNCFEDWIESGMVELQEKGVIAF